MGWPGTAECSSSMASASSVSTLTHLPRAQSSLSEIQSKSCPSPASSLSGAPLTARGIPSLFVADEVLRLWLPPTFYPSSHIPQAPGIPAMWKDSVPGSRVAHPSPKRPSLLF